MFQLLWNRFFYYLLYIVRFRGNNLAFLRYLGVKIGERCLISTSIRNFGTEPWLIEIGDDVSITDGVVFLTHDGSSRLFRKDYPEMNPKYGNRFGSIRILSNCFIGINSIIMPGVNIGPNAIIGSGSIVTKDVPEGCVAAGNPAHVISSLNEYIDRYKHKGITVQSLERDSLRRELSRKFWGEER